MRTIQLRNALTAALIAALLDDSAFAQFEPPVTIGGRVHDNSFGVGLLDVNNDGLLDVLVSEYNNFGAAGALRYFPNTGAPSGAFASPQTLFGQQTRAGRFAVVDVDEDGRLDVLLPSTEGSSTLLRWYRALGNGLFDPPVTVDSAPGSQRFFAATAADLDGDGDLDAVVTALDADQVRYIENLGGGASWGSAVTVVSGLDIPTSVEAADLDGDGLLDLLVVGQGDDRVAWARNLGGGAFGPAVTINVPSSSSTTTARAADLDGDGRLDVIATRAGSDRVSWLRGLGAGSFAAEVLIDDDLPGARDVLTVDDDHDGDLDILACGAAMGGGIRRYENLGSGFFGAGVDLPSSSPTVGLALGDLDGDSDLDVVGTGASHRWYRNAALLGHSACASTANSTGVNGVATITGSPRAADNRVSLSAVQLPPSTFGLFFASRTPAMSPGPGEGVLCLGGSIGRFVGPGQVQSTQTFGRMSIDLDLSAMPVDGAALAGESWHFQAWFRDVVGGSATSNFSDSVSIVWQ